MFQTVLGSFLLCAGILFGAVILYKTWRDKEEIARERGTVPFLSVAELLIFFFASIGISDFLPNTLVMKHWDLTEDRKIPGTLVACGFTPGAIIAFSLLRADTALDPVLLVVSAACVMAGSFTGARLVGKFDNRRIRNIMRVALVCSFFVLLGRMILTAGASGTATTVPGWQLPLVGILCFGSGCVNMFGIPMKPTWTALFLLLGLNSLTTLTLVLVIAALAPLTGGVRVLAGGLYHKKAAACAVIFGSVGAILGTSMAVSLPTPVLNVLLLAVMVIAIVTMFRK